MLSIVFLLSHFVVSLCLKIHVLLLNTANPKDLFKPYNGAVSMGRNTVLVLDLIWPA